MVGLGMLGDEFFLEQYVYKMHDERVMHFLCCCPEIINSFGGVQDRIVEQQLRWVLLLLLLEYVSFW
jgi:hypothetical protein